MLDSQGGQLHGLRQRWGQARTWLMELLCSRQVDSSSVVFAFYVCLGDLAQPPMHDQLQPARRTSKGHLVQRHWSNARVVGSIVRMVGSILGMVGNQEWQVLRAVPGSGVMRPI